MSSGTTPQDHRTVDYYEFASLKQDIGDMKLLMARMVEAMGRITVIEERQHVQATNTSKVLERMEEVTQRLHQNEVVNAAQSSIVQRVTNMEVVFREIHIESERNKARFDAVIWMVRGLWAVTVAGGAGLVWVIKAVIDAPIPGIK
jgi:hypothetical protein